MVQIPSDLREAALEAHAAGQGWATFWPRVRQRVGELDRFDRQRFQRLVGRLMHLLLTGRGKRLARDGR